MILYFSSTDNCKYTAEKLAYEFGDKAVSISEADNVNIKAGESLGFVFPTYFWRLPSIVDDYMKKLTLTSETESPYIYFISTYGSTCGQTATFMKRYLRKKGFKLSFSYGIKTVDDWTVWFDLTDKNIINDILIKEEMQINEAIGYIKEKISGNKMKDTLPMIAVIGSGVFYNSARKTKHLNVNNSCISCGICEKECPTRAIKIKNGKPVWVKQKCTMCLHCLHSCPKFAINYDNKTQNNGQYKHP